LAKFHFIVPYIANRFKITISTLTVLTSCGIILARLASCIQVTFVLMHFPTKRGSLMSKQKKRKKVSIFRLIILIFIIASFIAVGAAIGVGAAIARNLPNWTPEDFSAVQSSSVYDIDGRELTKLHAGENRAELKSINEVPENLINALLAIEDARFYDHGGIDFRALARAVVANVRGSFGSQGASTITQQLVKNAMLTNDKKIERKIQEAILALQVERKYTKPEILTFYFNWVYFGHGAYGIKAASETYFGKDLHELTLAESALLAGLVQRPNALTPYRNPEGAKTRRALVLNNMVKYNFISAEEAQAAKAEELNLPGLRQAAHDYPYFIDYVVDQAEQLLEDRGIERNQLRTGGLHVYTTLDLNVQRSAEKAFANKDLFPAPRPNEEHPVQGAIAVIDHRTGQIKALVGGREHVTERGLNRATQGLRQPGSAFKPIAVYGPALELGYSPGSVIDDVPVEYRYSNQVYAPSNLGGRYRGLITMREAIRWSPNVPAVDLLNTIGAGKGFEFAQRLGVPLESGDRGLSMALGGLTKGVSPLTMASAFGAFANQGVLNDTYAIIKITDQYGNVLVETNPNKKVVMSEETAFLMTDMMRTVVQSGTGTRAKLPNRPVAGKTGTTQLSDELRNLNLNGNTDAWFVGYTPELTAAVWIGYDRTDRNHFLSGVYGGNHPAMIFKATLEEALKNVPVTQFPRPSSIVSVTIDAKSGLLPSVLTPAEYIITELFNKKLAPTALSDAWFRAEVCAITGELLSEYCPDSVSKVFLRRPKPFMPLASNPKKPEDAVLELPTQVCTIHGPQTSVQVKICTDPTHEGVIYRAITGPDRPGCPEESTVVRAFAIGQEPKEYCPIPEHQVQSTLFPIPVLNQGNGNGNQGTGNGNQGALAPINNFKGQLIVGEGGFEGPNMVVQLTWNHPNSGSGNYEYLVYRATQRNFSVSEQSRLGGNIRITDSKFQDKNLELNQTYYYKIVVFDPATNARSNPSPELAIAVKP
jgi:penicillin-binding protein 1A